MRLPRNDMGVVISADDPKWIEPFSGLTEVQFARLVALVRRRGGDVQRGRPWRLPLAARVLLAATYWRTNLTLRQVAPLLLQRHHALLCRLHLERIDHLTGAIGELSARIEEEILPFCRELELLQTIPGVGQGVAEVLIAQTGGDMARFATAGHLASWAGVCPGHHESAGKHKSGRRRHHLNTAHQSPH